MSLELTGEDRKRFAKQLAQHRNGYPKTDADYARSVLGVSLNTFKRCINATDHPALSFKRNTFISIFQGAGLDPANFGLEISLPSREARFGGYGQADYPHLPGRYLIYRRSFLTALNIVRGVLDIQWDDQLQCYTHSETHSYKTDFGNPYENSCRGEIHIQKQRNLMFLPSMLAGDVRLMMLHLPETPATTRQAQATRTRGCLLTYGNPKDFYQPIVSAVVVEKRGDVISGDVRALCATMRPGTKEFAAISADLQHAEEHAVVMTPLMWARSAHGGLKDTA